MIVDWTPWALEPVEQSQERHSDQAQAMPTSGTVETRNPVWSRDELNLALDLYVRHRHPLPGPGNTDVVALSELLNRIGRITRANMNEVYRNPNGVAMKLQNFRRFDPDQKGKGLPGGGRGEEDVWDAFIGQPDRLKIIAAAFEQGLPELESLPPEVIEQVEEAEEGAVRTRLHRFREREHGIVERRKAKALKNTGTLACEACGFDCRERYCSRGDDFTDCHHAVPMSALKPGERTKATNLVLLCANCHRMVHVARPWLDVDQLKILLGAHYRNKHNRTFVRAVNQPHPDRR